MMIDNIVEKIIACLKGIDEERMHQLMVKHYQIFNLLDENGVWVTPRLQKLSGELLGKTWNENRVISFVEKMAELAQKNEYLVRFLQHIEGEHFDTLMKKYEQEGMSVIPDIVAYAIVLELLSVQMYQDTEFIQLIMNIFNQAKKNPQLFRYKNTFHKVKLFSVAIALGRNLKIVKSGKLDPQFTRWLLPINILEALLFDVQRGNTANAKSCWPLIINRPGTSRQDPLTGAGPSVWSENKNFICGQVPLPKEWADLYQTWNMAFISKAPMFIYLLPKLLIPQVADYQDKPVEYICNRVLALYLTLHYSGFLVPTKEKLNEPVYYWSDKKLTALWGKSNLASADLYKQELVKRRGQTERQQELVNA